MASELLWAVTDGPDGTSAVALPDDRFEALAIKAKHHGAFWCTTEANGCGGSLILNAGEVRVPYFRHHPGAPCSFIGSESKAGPAYEHLRYQQAFAEWVIEQGYTPTLEKVLGTDGRTDLHVVVDQVSHAIEIQLSPLSAVSWQERDTRYRRRVDHVTWLYGPAAESAGASELSQRGLSFSLKPGPEVGVRDVDDQTRWVPLASCRLTADGFQAPGVVEAKALHLQRQQEKVEAARLKAEQEERDRLAAQQRLQREREARARAAAARPVRPEPPRLDFGHLKGLDGLDRWEALYPEAQWWQPDRGWGWLDSLPPELHRTARALTYTTQVLTFASPVATVFRELTDPEVRTLLFERLEEMGLVRRYFHDSGIQRWERTQP